MTTCKGCGQPILWVKTESGAKMPLSVASKQKRFVVKALSNEMLVGSAVDTYLSHWGDCPQAGQFRKEREPHREEL